MSAISSWIALAVLAAAPWPLYRLLSIPSFRRYYFCFALRAAVLLVGYAICLALVATHAASLLAPAAALAVFCLAGERWRARSTFGAKSGLPPGRLTLVPRGPWVDESFFSRQAAANGPIFKTSQYFRPMVCVMGAERGIALLKDNENRLLPPRVRFSSFIPKGFIRYMAPADHSHYRVMFQKMINRRVIADCEKDIDFSIHNMLSHAVESGHADHCPRQLLEPMLLEAFLRLFFNVTSDNESYATVVHWYRQLDIRKASCASGRREKRAAQTLAEILSTHSKLATEHTCFLSELLESSPEATDDQTVFLNLVYMMQVGRTDMLGFLSWVLKFLLDNPDCQEQLRSLIDSRRTADASDLAGRIVKETLRLEQSEFIFRRAMEDVEFAGFRIPAGWAVRVCIREGHRDPKIFENPHRFDPGRFKGTSYNPTQYSPLGLLGHTCLGGPVISSIASRFVLQLVGGYDLEKTRDGPREYGQAHWQPSRNLRVALLPRPPASS